ncbi:hypothetical protein BASA81_011923 [Batrachochytrium salamandrivorans]|nr:hypothetical protein BASA81_011923 [Batrachochytrium salamandrivorans]
MVANNGSSTRQSRPRCSDGRTDLVFAAARAMSGNSSRSAAVTPLYNSDGIVQYDPTSSCVSCKVTMDHWQPTPQVTRWTCNTGMIVSLFKSLSIHHQSETVTFSTRISRGIRLLQPFADESTESTWRRWYNHCVLPSGTYMPANTQEGVPPTPFARALLRKDGDPLNPGDKRGIALINVGLKLVCKVLQMRIERFVETNNLLSYEQAGFRKREECVGQVVSLVDIIQRRQNAGLNTHVLFIDIRKAFDTVPVGALLWKLQNMGFPRRTLAFLKALYTSSSARAGRITVIGPIPSTEGCQTGMSIVWTAVQLFINDILDGVAPITVPGLPRDTNPIRGLMYADDVAVLLTLSVTWLRRLLSSNGPISGRCSLVWPSVASSASLAI